MIFFRCKTNVMKVNVSMLKTANAIPDEPIMLDGRTGGTPQHDLRGKTARGALASMLGQMANFILRVGSMVALARLLSPADFGLMGMATACTGFLELFRDAGLSLATVQRPSITQAQTSTLFWVNLAVGCVLAALCVAVAPALAAFYKEPRLLWVTIALGVGFIFNGAAVQHRAILTRNMRFAALAALDLVALIACIAVGIGMALAGMGYWALVGMALSVPIVSLFGTWAAVGWIPSLPRRRVGARSMLRYGGTVTLRNLVAYIAYNTDKVLIGRFCGAAILGIYGRAYQLINLPTQNLNSAIGQVAVPALSRLQNDPKRLRTYFLKGYGLFLSLAMPITMACALSAKDITWVFLGAKWLAAVPFFRLLAPTILTSALINPLSWLLLATNQAGRGLKIALFMAPIVILGFVIGFAYGPNGVAAGFSVSTALLVVPAIFWATRGTSVTVFDTLRAIRHPFVSMIIGAGIALATRGFIHSLSLPLERLVAANLLFFGVYAIVLLFVMGQKPVYIGLLQDFGIWRLTGLQRKTEW